MVPGDPPLERQQHVQEMLSFVIIHCYHFHSSTRISVESEWTVLPSTVKAEELGASR
jgi:hypothetical protein